MKDRGLIYQTMWILNKEKRESGVEKFSKKWEFFTKPEGHESLKDSLKTKHYKW